MDAQGKVIFISQILSGVSKSTGRDWVTQEYVIEVPGQYPRKICFSIFGQDRINEAHIQMGDEVIVSFDIDAREYNGRWFNSIRAYRVVHVDPNAPMQGQSAPFNQMQGQPAPFNQYAQPAPAQPMQQPVQQTPFTQANPFDGAPASSDADDLPF